MQTHARAAMRHDAAGTSGRPQARYLWVTRFIPEWPFRGGDADYTRNMIASLSQVAQVDVLCFDNGAAIPPDRATLRWHVLPRTPRPRWLSVPHPLPNIAYQFQSRALLATARELAAGADAIFVDHVAMAWCVPPLAARPARPPVVFVTHNHEATLRRQMSGEVRNPLKRPPLWLDAIKAGRIETAAVDAADALTAITEADAEAFRRQRPAVPVRQLSPGYDGPFVPARRIDGSVPRRICLLGNTRAFHKRMVIEEALAALAGLDPASGIVVDVVGDIDARLRHSAPGCAVFHGHLDDLAPVFARSRLTVMADHVGGGFKLRALTFAAHRVPMLTVEGALAGMGLVAGRDFIERPSMAAVIAAIPALIDDYDQLNRVQEAAFATCQSGRSWAERGRTLADFAQAVARGHAA